MSVLKTLKCDNEELVKQYQNGSKQALDDLLQQNIGIIKKIAENYNKIGKKGIEFDDLFNSGVIGLIAAAKNYDFNNEKKAKFITYAVHYINRQICICANGRSDKEIQNNKLYNFTKSLNTPIGQDEDIELLDIIQVDDNSFENVEYKLYLKQLRQELEKVMNECLSLREREVIKFLYGWECDVMKMQEVGEILNITRERVRQIKENAFRKIRHTSWCRIKGQEYYNEIFGGRKLSYSNIERELDFINRYFDDLMGV